MEKLPKDIGSKVDAIEPIVPIASVDEGTMKHFLTQDEYQLAQLGYKQEFFRGLGLFENW